jgi:hypothetical protein
MKVSVNDQELFTLSDTQKQVIKHEIPSEIFDADMNRRLQWILMHKYEECFKTLKAEWDPKLAANGVQMIPTDPDAYAQLVFAQPNYKDRSTREATNAETLTV